MEAVDLIYQDVAQPNQVEIAERNLAFLKPGGHLILMLKTRSVDVRRDPTEVLSEARAGLLRRLDVVEVRWLEPYHHDHAAIVCSLRE
jgi:fibrillarin-like pre-rRNA processing protein